MPTITELWRYPVKSMQGERVGTAQITDRGIVGDRAFALIDQAEGRVVSAKHPRKWGRVLHFAAATLDHGVVEITSPDGTVVRSDDPDVDRVLSDALGREVTLASSAPSDRHYESVYPDVEGVVPEQFLADNKTGDEADGTLTDIGLGLAAPPGTFFDLTVLHLVTTATLAQLDVDVRRLRPNVVVAVDGTGFVENDWVGKNATLGATAVASIALPTMRCVMTTLTQPELPQDRGVLRAVARTNRIEIPGLGTWACAGVYANVTTGGRIAVADPVGID